MLFSSVHLDTILQESTLPRARLNCVHLYICDAKQSIGHVVDAKEILLTELKFS